MKKRILYLSSFILIVLGVCIFIDQALFKPTEINSFIATKVYSSPANKAFTDDNFYKCVVDAYNSENKTSLPYTTNLSDSQLGSIKKLSCNGYYKSDEEKIKNTNGLEKLTALTYLSVGGNQLTELDVSNNTALTYLNVTTNQLTSLNVSSNTALTYLSVSKNHLTELDVSNNIALIDLEAAGNQLTELDVSKNTALTYLYVSENNLTSLDFSKNVALKKLYVSENNLTSLDVSRNTALTYLSVSKNHLTELDVSKNTALTYLSVTTNQLTELDVSKNTALIDLYVHNNTFVTNIIIYKGGINVDNDNRFVKLPEGKTSTLTSLKSDDNDVNIDDNNININKIGEYVVTADYKHDIQNNFNTYSGTYNIKVIEITSDKYVIDEEDSYIYTGTDTDNNTILSNINLDSECTKVIENNELIIKYKDEVLKKFKVINISSSKYDLSKEYIYDNNFNKDNINVTNGTSEVVDNELLIKYNDDVLERYKIVSISSSKYDLNKEYIYVGTGDIDLDSIKVINGTIELVDNELILKYGGEVLDRYKIIGIKFGELKVNIDLVVITENISYDMFISNITTNGVTYKIFNGEEEVTSGNISKGMVVKVYYNDEEVYTYNITNEYLEFIDPLEVVDETKRIYNVKLNTSVNDLLSKINTSGTIIVRNNKNEVISGNALVGTGTKVIIKLSSGTKEYTLVIKGDVTGTGTSSVSDVAKLYQYLKKKINMEDYFIEAGNVVNTDNEIRINDVAKLYQFIKGKLNSLE